MLISNFDKTLSTCRMLKTPIVSRGNIYYPFPNEVECEIDNGYLLGTYDDLCIVRMMPLIGQNFYIDESHLASNEWMLVNKVSSSLKNIGETSGIIEKNFIEGINYPIRNFYVDVNKELNIKWMSVLDWIDVSASLTTFNFKSLPQFVEFNSMTADDGAMILRLSPEYCIFVYKGLIPYAKDDDVLITVYDHAYSNQIMVCFKTIKKKSPPIYTFVKYLIDRRNN